MRRALGVLGAAVAVLVAAGALLSAAPAQAAGPVWGLQVTHSPDTFHRGEFSLLTAPAAAYNITATNTGDAPTSGPFTITDPLLVGLTIGETSSFRCAAQYTTPTTVICSSSAPLAPGETISFEVPLNVAKDAPDPLVNTVTVSGGGAPDVTVTDSTPVADKAPFAVKSFTAATTDEAEADYALAGGHPFRNRVRFDFPLDGIESPVEFLKDAGVDLPLGFLGDPAAAPRCSISIIPVAEFIPGSICPVGSKVGYASVGTSVAPIYNVKPDRGYPAQFAFHASNTTTVVSLYVTFRPRTESYGLIVGSTDANRAGFVRAIDTIFCNYGAEFLQCNPSAAAGQAPFLTNSVDCSDADPTWKLAIDSWEHAGAKFADGLPDLSDPNWKTATTPATPVTGCDALTFEPTIATRPLPLQSGGPVQADSPSGLAVDLDFPQNNDPTDPNNTTIDASLPQTPEPKDITVKLPAGLSISPSSADGLGACSDQASDPAGDQVHYDSTKPVTCPDSSKIGTAVATSPLLAVHDPVDDHVVGPEPIPGSVYLLAPHPDDLPVGGGNQAGEFRLLIVLENAERGINFKLPGVATADPNTGRLTATFSENPQLPSSHITVNLKSGARAPLATPTTCGSFQTTSDLVPWSSPGTPDAHPTASFNVGSGPNGTACPLSPATRPFAPTMSAGTESSAAGQPSPFTLHIARADGEQELSSLEAILPKGLAAKFVDVPYCSEAALATAATRSGQAEQANPSCPASRIGSVTVGAGPGTNPFYAHGNAYLSGPYKGAPMSVSVITPAVAGPFDLGTVVSRNALFINPETAQGHVVSDPFPTILDGVPLRLRSIDVRLDRPNFTLNPTNCEEMPVTAAATSLAGLTVPLTDRFQAGDCAALGFRPSLALSLSGGLARNGHPALRAVLRSGAGEAGIAAATLTLPGGGLLDVQHLRALCARQLPAESCPRASRAGYMRLWSPLLDRPLEGQVYLRAPSHRLPDLLADLHGGGLHLLLHGRTAAAPGGRMRISFPTLPDVPLTKAVVTLPGGRRGIFVNSEALCARPRHAAASLSAHNGKQRRLRPLVRLRGNC